MKKNIILSIPLCCALLMAGCAAPAPQKKPQGKVQIMQVDTASVTLDPRFIAEEHLEMGKLYFTQKKYDLAAKEYNTGSGNNPRFLPYILSSGHGF